MVDSDYFAKIRRQYGILGLIEKNMPVCPFLQFKAWFDEVINLEIDPNAMVLSTVDLKGRPDSRVVLLKGIIDKYFIFYTNYSSKKAKQLQTNPFAALNFYWPNLARQIRIRGKILKVSAKISDNYFATRPFESQISVYASDQSQEIIDRKILEEKFDYFKKTFDQKVIQRPDNWGGFKLKPYEFEFWQGRDNRLHDRISYKKKGKDWRMIRLAP